mgnify:CR=1 FL=1
MGFLLWYACCDFSIILTFYTRDIMGNLKKSKEVAGNCSFQHAKPHKHDANLKENSALYFQVGLILCLLLSYVLFEMRFEEKNLTLTKVKYDDPNVEVFPINFVLEKEVFKQTSEVSRIGRASERERV